MIFQQIYGNGRYRLILGAKNETVTYSGTGGSGSVTLDGDGKGSVKLANGTYQLNGGVSGYETTVTIDNATTTVWLRPVGAIYWYGVFTEQVFSSYVSDPGPVEEDTYFKWEFPTNSTTALYTNNGADEYGECHLKYRGFFSTDGYCRIGYDNGPPPNYSTSPPLTEVSQTVWNNTTLSITPASGSTVRLYGNSANRDYYIEVQEWYLGDR